MAKRNTSNYTELRAAKHVSNQKGFSALHVLLIVLVVGVIGGVGFVVYHHSKKSNNTVGSDPLDATLDQHPTVTDQIFSNAQVGGDGPKDIQIFGFYKKPLKVQAVSLEYGKDAKHLTNFRSGLVSGMTELDGNPCYIWDLKNLSPNTKYYYDVGATVDDQGNDKILFSSVKSFTTPQ